MKKWMSRHNHLLCRCSAPPTAFTLPGTSRKYERSRPFDVEHLKLNIRLDMKKKGIDAEAELRCVRRSPQGTRLTLDAVGFSVASVTYKKKGAKKPIQLKDGASYDYDGDQLHVDVPEGDSEFTVNIEYSVVPRCGLYFLAPDKKVPSRPVQVWSQCQDEDGRYFFPCLDKPHAKMTSEMVVDAPAALKVLSGGDLVSVKKGRSRSIWHYSLVEKTPAYLLTLIAGTFDEWEEVAELKSGKKVPLRYLVPPGKKADGKRAFECTSRIMKLFSEKFGVDFPWERYTQTVVADFIFGGMENTTATTMYEHILLDKRATIDIESDDLVAHEMAHQWFGDLVTCRDWSHAWLNEGFATYSELVEKEDRLGEDEYEYAVEIDMRAYLAEASGDYQRPIVCRDYDEPIDLFDRHLYQKGGLVLHHLRKHLGDDAFFGGISLYLNRFAHSIAETNDLMRSLEEYSGVGLERFFDEWVFSPGHASLEYSSSFEDGILRTNITQKRVGGDALFLLNYKVSAGVGGKVFTVERESDAKNVELALGLPGKPDWIAIDPDCQLSVPSVWKASADLLRRSLNAPKARNRRMAAKALSKRQDLPSIEALTATLLDEKEFHSVRSAAAASLGAMATEESDSVLLKSAAKIKDARVRRALTTSLAKIDAAGPTLKGLFNDESYLVAAEAARSYGKLRTEDAVKTLAPLLRKKSWADVAARGAIDGLSSCQHEDAAAHLLKMSEYGQPLRARRGAIAALGRLEGNRKARLHLEKLLTDHDPHLRAAAADSLGALGDAAAAGPLKAGIERESNGWVIRSARQALSALAGEEKSSALPRQLSNLEREVQKLKARLARYEEDAKAKKPALVKKAAAPRKSAARKKAASKSAKR